MSIYSSVFINTKEGPLGEYGYWDIAVAMFKTEDYVRITYAGLELMLTPDQARELSKRIMRNLDE